MASNETKLLSPDGRDYTATSPSEVTRLKARGYTEKTRKTSPSSTPTSK